MRFLRFVRAGLSTLLLGALACGGSTITDADPPLTNTPGNTAGTGPMSATINGTDWKTTNAAAKMITPHSLFIAAVEPPYVIEIGVGTDGTGTFSFASDTVASALVIRADAQWSNTAGSSGTLTITTFTATRIAGTFTLDVPARSGSDAAPALHITNGKFDLPNSM